MAGDALSAALSGVPLGLWQQAFPKDVVSLYYHVVSDCDLPHLKLYRYKSREQFEADLCFAKSRCISYEELRAQRNGDARSAPNRILITFDDGLAECFDTVRPLLLKHSMNAAFFVSTGFLDDANVFHETAVSLCIDAIERAEETKCAEFIGRMLRNRPLHNDRTARRMLRDVRITRPLTENRRRLLLWLLGLAPGEQREIDALCDWLCVDAERYVRERAVFMTTEQVRGLAADGFTVGAHGVRHRSLASLTPDEMRHEIVSSCNTIREITGQLRVPFAFPYNGLNIDRNLLASIKQGHPFIDLFFDSGMLRAEPSFVVSRVAADDPMGAQGTTLPHVLTRAWAKPTSWYATHWVNQKIIPRRDIIPVSPIPPL